MKRIMMLVMACCCLMLAIPAHAQFTDQVVVESKTVAPGETGVTVGVFVENNTALDGIVVPLELREVTAGAFTTSSFSFGLVVGNRVEASGVDDFPTNSTYPTPAANTCSGPTSNTYAASGAVDFVSPDAVLFTGVRILGTQLAPGTDGANPSFRFTFDVTNTDGCFEIDTCCATPANHLVGVIAGPGGPTPLPLAFTKGVITIGAGCAVENEPPVAQCVDTLYLEADQNCEASTTPGDLDNGSFDPDGISVNLSSNDLGPWSVGYHDTYLVVEDADGAFDSCLVTVCVEDVTPPVLANCPPDTVFINNDLDSCGAAFGYADGAGATDNCDQNPTVVYEPAFGTYLEVGYHDGYVIATDSSGNADTCAFVICVEDTQKPTIVCPEDQFISTDSGTCETDNYTLGGTVDDNCPGATAVCGFVNPPTPKDGQDIFLPVGVWEVWCVAVDAAGNESDTCFYSITVEDNEPPVAGCPGPITVDNDPGQCGANVNFSLPASTDNCSIDSVVTSANSGDFFPVGLTEVDVVAWDASGNSNTCTFSVTVNDTEAPTVTCPDSVYLLVPNGTLGGVANWSTSSSDNCGIDTEDCDSASGSFFLIGRTEVCCIATDGAGNADTCCFEVIVEEASPEPVPPVAICQADSAFLYADGNCEANAPAAAFDNGSNDPDGGSVSLALNPPGPWSVGYTSVWLVVTDDEQDKDSCETIVCVMDTTKPTVECPNDTTIFTRSDACEADYFPGALPNDDNCGIQSVVCLPRDIIIADKDAQSFPLPTGQHVWYCVATDVNGNESDTCFWTVTVEDNVAPEFTVCPQDFGQQTDQGTCGALVNYTVEATDNCSVDSIVCDWPSGSTFPHGTTTVTCIAYDAAGNTDTCTFDVTIFDDEDPVVQCIAETTLYIGPDCYAEWDPGAGLLSYSDNCDANPTVICDFDKDAGAVGEQLTVGTWFFCCAVTDSSGNQASCCYTVYVYDTTPPMITCPADTTVYVCNDVEAEVFYEVDTSDCSGVTLDCNPPSGSFFPVGATEVTCYAYDEFQNVDSCKFKVTVISETLHWEAQPDTICLTASCGGPTDTLCVTVTEVGCEQFKVENTLCWEAFWNDAPWLSGEGPGGPGGCNGEQFCFWGYADTLPPGTYGTWVYIQSLDGIEGDSVWVKMTINNDLGDIVIEPDTLCFTYTGEFKCDTIVNCPGKIAPIGDCDTVITCVPVDQFCDTITIEHTGCGEVCWYVFEETAPWYSIERIEGETPDRVQICVDPCGLPSGKYYDTLFICPCVEPPAKDADVGGCDAIIIKLVIPNPPLLVVDPTTVKFDLYTMDPDTVIKVDIANLGGGDLIWHAWNNAGWLNIDPMFGIAPSQLCLTVDTTGLVGPDTLVDTIYVEGYCAVLSPAYVIVTLCIPPPPCGSICGHVCSNALDKGDSLVYCIGIPNACVQAWDSYPDGQVIASDSTDEFGNFCLEGLIEGDYDVRAYADGYCTDVVFDVPCGTDDLHIGLDEIPFFEPPNWPWFCDYYSIDAREEGVPLLVGDVILAMDPDGVYCGVAFVQNSGQYLLHVLGDDPATPEDEGAEEGDKITLLLNCDCPAVADSLWTNQGNFEYDVDFDCNTRTICCDLCYPWNLISINVYPVDPSIPNIFSSIEPYFTRVYSGTCEDGDLSWERDRPINDLNAINPLHGFGLKVTEPDLTLCITGVPIPPSTPIELCEGWNLVSYLPNESDDLNHALQSIDGLYTAVLGFDCDGWHSNVVERPVNDLLCLDTCLGYWINMTEDATLVYPSAGYECVPELAGAAKIVNRVDRLSLTPYSSDFWSAGDPQSSDIYQGDEIIARTIDGTICGVCIAGGNGSFLMHVVGDDPQTAQVEGAQPGEEITFAVNSQPASVIGSAVWSDRSSNEISLVVGEASAVPTEWSLNQNYPNPFNPSTAISFALKANTHVKLSIYNVLGQNIRTLLDEPMSAGTHTVIWDGTNDRGRLSQSGIYFYRIDTDEWSQSRKMTLLK